MNRYPVSLLWGNSFTKIQTVRHLALGVWRFISQYMLLTKVKETIKKHRMLKPGDCVVVAVSGGADSVCLLSTLHILSKDFDITLHIAHLDHMFRGQESADDALFVADIAKKLSIPATIEKVNVPAFCIERGLSAQEGARIVRYGFLRRVAHTMGASRIATGHTADDQAETFLMRLIRGAGVAGLSAIPPVRENIIRPLIAVTRDEVLEYIQGVGLGYATDSSNAKPVYARNRVRLDILPALKQFNPRIVETLATEAALLRDEDEAMDACLSTMSAGVLSQEENVIALKRGEFNALPQAFRRRLFRKVVEIAGVESAGLSSCQIDEALAFMAAAQTGRTMRLPYSLTIEREYDHFLVSFQATAKKFSYTLALPGLTAVPEIGLQVETMIVEASAQGRAETNYFWQAMFDYDIIQLPLTLRTRLRGDRFCPAGMGGRSKKLQDFFVDEKVPRRKRDTVPLLVSGDAVLWVVGFRTDERFLPGEETKRLLKVGVSNAEQCIEQRA